LEKSLVVDNIDGRPKISRLNLDLYSGCLNYLWKISISVVISHYHALFAGIVPAQACLSEEDKTKSSKLLRKG